MSIAQPSFSTGTVLDPTRNALAAVTSARRSLSDMLDRSMKQDAIAKAQARQKILDDRATAEYNNQVQERDALSKFDKAILAPRQTVYADANSNAKLMSAVNKIALTPEEMALQKQGKTTPEIDAKLKAQYDLGANFGSAGVKETEWEKAQRIAREQGLEGSLAVNQRLYSIKAADAAAKAKKEAAATTQKADLLKQYNKDKSEYNKYSVKEIGHYGGSSGKSGTQGKSYKNDVWDTKSLDHFYENANKMTPWFWPGQGDSGDVKGLMKVAQTLKVGPKQLEQILIPYGFGTEERIIGGESLEDPAGKKSKDEVIKEIYSKIKAAHQANLAAGSKGNTEGGFYNKKDTSNARRNLLADMQSLQQQMSGIKTDYSTDLTPEERSQKAIGALADKYFKSVIDKPKTGKTSTTSGGTKKPSAQTVKDIIGGAIGKAVNSPKKGELAKLVTENPVQFGKEYDSLGSDEQARVNKILQSDASNEYFNSVPVKSNTESFDPKKLLSDLGYDPQKAVITKEGKIMYPDFGGRGMHDITKNVKSRTAEFKQTLRDLNNIDETGIKNLSMSKLRNMIELSKEHPEKVNSSLAQKLRQEMSKRAKKFY